MIQVSDELKEIYRKDVVPLTDEIKKKRFLINFPDLNITVENNRIVSGSAKLVESICSEQELTFGGCEASSFEIKLADVDETLIGERMVVQQWVEGNHIVPYGEYIVESVEKTDDLRFKQVMAYDISSKKLSKDVNSWYNNLAFPLPLKEFRRSLFEFIDLPCEEQDLIHDGIKIEKTIKASTLTAREVARAIAEINGTFGFMRRTGKFSFLSVAAKGLYPREDLFPEEDLFPSEAYESLGKSSYITTKYEEYETQAIDCLQIRQEEGDVGAVVFDTEDYKNPYIVTGNFLVYGKNAEELSEIARNLLDKIGDISYNPQQTTMLGLPYMEPGDTIVIYKRKDAVESYVFSRTLTGGQVLRDEIEAAGSESRENKVSPNQEIQMLKGKSFVLKKTVEGLDLKITDVEANAMAKIEATATEIRGEVSTIDSSLRSLISITATEIRSEVSDEVKGLNSKITQTATEIRSEVSNEVKGLNSKITQTATDIRTEIRNEVSGLNSTISQTATQIRTEIKNEVDGLNSTITQTSTSINTRITNEVAGLSSSISQTATSIRSEIKNEVKGLNSTISQTESSINTKINNEVEKVNSSISQTANSINTRITNEVTGLSSSISQTESSLTSKISSVSGNVSSLTQDVGKIETRVSDAEGNVTTLQQNVNSLSSRVSNAEDEFSEVYQDIRSITFTVSDLDGNLTKLEQTVNGFDFTGLVTINDLKTAGSTTINGSNITTGKLTGVAAEFTEQDGAYWWGGDHWICDTNGLYCYDDRGRQVTFRVFSDSGEIDHCGEIYPDDSWYKGWGITECLVDLYEKVSDKRLKNSIRELTEEEIQFILSIIPVSFIYNDKRGDESIHYGFIAQNIKEELEKYGIENIICKKITSGRNKGYYGIAYDELIAPIIGMLQRINKRVEKLEENQWMQT